MIDVEEVYTLETWMVGEPLKKYQKKVLKKREEKRQLKAFPSVEETATTQPIKPSAGATKKSSSGGGGGVEDYLKKLTQSLRQNTSSPTLFATLHQSSAMKTNKSLTDSSTDPKNQDIIIDTKAMNTIQSKDSDICSISSHTDKSSKPKVITDPRLQTSKDTLENHAVL